MPRLAERATGPALGLHLHKTLPQPNRVLIHHNGSRSTLLSFFTHLKAQYSLIAARAELFRPPMAAPISGLEN